MNLKDITPEDVLAGGNWIVVKGDHHENPEVEETMGFEAKDVGLFSAVAKFADESEHPALVIRSFPEEGEDIEIFVSTKIGWLNLQVDGFHRAMGKYHNEVFPFDYFLGNPWQAGSPPAPDFNSPHPKIFQDAVSRIWLKIDSK